MANSRKRSVEELDSFQSDVQQVPDNNDYVVDRSESPAKRHHASASKTDHNTITADQALSHSKTDLDSTTNKSEEISVPENEDKTNCRDSTNNVDKVPTATAEQVPTQTTEQSPPVPTIKSLSTTSATSTRDNYHHHQRHHQYQVVPRKEPTIFNIRPVDDITIYIADVIGRHLETTHVEIEAKLGVLVEKRTGRRINIGASTETIITAMDRYRFESNMPREQHRNFNERLNALVNASQSPGRERIEYRHTYETDTFYQMGSNKWRVTTDQKTKRMVKNGIIEKRRVTDINIHIPTQPLDYRISINVEMPRTKPTSHPSFVRHKDRISYQHGGIQFDLTQVKGDSSTEEPRHELELEIKDPLAYAREKRKMDNREPSQYYEMVEMLVNNVRMLSRKALKLGTI